MVCGKCFLWIGKYGVLFLVFNYSIFSQPVNKTPPTGYGKLTVFPESTNSEMEHLALWISNYLYQIQYLIEFFTKKEQ